jgi:hypothetical protein
MATASVSTLAGTSGVAGSTNGVGTMSQFNFPIGVAISADGTYALVADRDNHLIRRIDMATASVSTLVGISGSFGFTNGVGTNSRFNQPRGVAISADGTYALVADSGNHLIRRINMTTASVSTLAGTSGVAGSTNGVGTNSQFRNPYGVAIFADGTYALVADWNNHLIRRIRSDLSVPSLFPSSLPSLSPSSLPSLSPSSLPSLSPSSLPSIYLTSHPVILRPTLFGFGVKISVLSSEKAILVDYLRDAKRGEIFPCLSSLLPHSLSLPLLSAFCFRQDASHLSHRQLLSSLLSFRPSLVL